MSNVGIPIKCATPPTHPTRVVGKATLHSMRKELQNGHWSSHYTAPQPLASPSPGVDSMYFDMLEPAVTSLALPPPQ